MTDTAADPAGTPSAPHPSVEQVVAALDAAGDRVVLRHPDGETTGAELLAAIHRYARALAGLGIGTGDLVAQYGPNRPERWRCATRRTSSTRPRCTSRPRPGRTGAHSSSRRSTRA